MIIIGKLNRQFIENNLNKALQEENLLFLRFNDKFMQRLINFKPLHDKP